MNYDEYNVNRKENNSIEIDVNNTVKIPNIEGNLETHSLLTSKPQLTSTTLKTSIWRSIFKFTLIILILILLIGGGGVALYYLTKHGYLLRFLEWIQRIGIWGQVIMILCLIFVNIPFTTGYGILMMASGFLFQFKNGLIVVIIGCQIGVFLVGVLLRLSYFRVPALRVTFLSLFNK